MFFPTWNHVVFTLSLETERQHEGALDNIISLSLSGWTELCVSYLHSTLPCLTWIGQKSLYFQTWVSPNGKRPGIVLLVLEAGIQYAGDQQGSNTCCSTLCITGGPRAARSVFMSKGTCSPLRWLLCIYAPCFSYHHQSKHLCWFIPEFAQIHHYHNFLLFGIEL